MKIRQLDIKINECSISFKYILEKIHPLIGHSLQTNSASILVFFFFF